MTETIRKQFENHPRFRGMDFRRSESNPEFYESPYANGAFDGFRASFEDLVIDLPEFWDCGAGGLVLSDDEIIGAIEAAGLKVKP